MRKTIKRLIPIITILLTSFMYSCNERRYVETYPANNYNSGYEEQPVIVTRPVIVAPVIVPGYNNSRRVITRRQVITNAPVTTSRTYNNGSRTYNSYGSANRSITPTTSRTSSGIYSSSGSYGSSNRSSSRSSYGSSSSSSRSSYGSGSSSRSYGSSSRRR